MLPNSGIRLDQLQDLVDYLLCLGCQRVSIKPLDFGIRYLGHYAMLFVPSWFLGP